MPPFLPLDRYPTFVTTLDQQPEHLSDGHLTLAEWHQPPVVRSGAGARRILHLGQAQA